MLFHFNNEPCMPSNMHSSITCTAQFHHMDRCCFASRTLLHSVIEPSLLHYKQRCQDQKWQRVCHACFSFICWVVCHCWLLVFWFHSTGLWHFRRSCLENANPNLGAGHGNGMYQSVQSFTLVKGVPPVTDVQLAYGTRKWYVTSVPLEDTTVHRHTIVLSDICHCCVQHKSNMPPVYHQQVPLFTSRYYVDSYVDSRKRLENKT